ncbi:extensin family protein [Caenispirillum bisanense]|uniref:Extensin-like protein C-terminus n=1 Tax=Caenispirillum bisanense TaxID=414052 RepID=A0A286G461_9PROT|nr:extensin family protein [Caenispirillum bisanense]SOD90016.1 Extensin-like protein C-terminus [Caenispirillum bisanense]
MRHFIPVALLLIVAGLALAVWRGPVEVPDRWNPWAPLRITEAPNILTPMKLSLLEADGDLCRAALASADALAWTPLPDRPSEEGCGLTDAVRITEAEPGFGEPITATCRLAVAWALFEHHELAPAAQEELGTEVARIGHYGTQVCRNIAGSSRRSEHATANALDLSSLRLADGRTVSVARHWEEDSPRGRFLRRIHAGACRFFDVVLGPDYNAAHADHLHLDMGPFGTCR